MLKIIKRSIKIICVFFILILILIGVALYKLDSIVAYGINVGAPKWFGIQTKVEEVTIRPLSGLIKLKNFTLANPEGYAQHTMLFSVNSVYVDINMDSLFGETVLIRKILINHPQFSYEVKNGKSNMDALISQLKGTQTPKAKQKTQEEAPAKKGEGKKVIIEEFTVNYAQLSYASPLTRGKFIPLPLPSITMKNIGKDEGGLSTVDAAIEIMNSLMKSFAAALTNIGGLIGSSLGDGIKAATDTVNASLKSATDAIGSDVMKATTDTLGSAIKATTEAVGSGAKATTDAVKSTLQGAADLIESKSSTSSNTAAPASKDADQESGGVIRSIKKLF